jgi:hypothetical protein
MIQFIADNKAALLGAALAISEVLALIPSVKANSMFQLIFGWLSKKP